MTIVLNKESLTTFDRSSAYEWIDTNGIGGWASGTGCGANTRRYHGLLVAAQSTSQRWVVLSHLLETLVVGRERFELSSDEFNSGEGRCVHPQGFQRLERFERGSAVDFDYRVGEFLVRKSILALHGENSTMLRYELLEGASACLLELRLFMAGRDIHALTRQNPDIDTFATFEQGVLRCPTYHGLPSLEVRIEQGRFVAQPDWWTNFWYRAEAERGFEAGEDLFTPGSLHLALFPNHPVFLHCHAGIDSAGRHENEEIGKVPKKRSESRSLEPLWEKEIARRERLTLAGTGVQAEEYQALLLAADQFIVRRGARRSSIIAGYPWFTDWGRDAMISIPGLCLCTQRFDEARDVLLLFKEHMRHGLLPNRFPDGDAAPEYNSVDGSLWAFEIVWQFLRESLQREVVEKQFLPMLTDIAENFTRGTDYQIRVDSDGLLCAGDSSTQLTWMDARADGVPVTPRHGKPVEINALWINALLVLARLNETFGDLQSAQRYQARANAAARAFVKSFWLEAEGHLADCLLYDRTARSWTEDVLLRPNQILALSLSMPGVGAAQPDQEAGMTSFELIPEASARRMLKLVRQELFVGLGLRTLSPSSPGYSRIYAGGPSERDRAYHQGTVWPWLLAPYLRAVARYGTPADLRSDGDVALAAIKAHLREAGVGSISEICDASDPYHPRGCPFQAWSVAAAVECFHLLGMAP